MKKIFGFIKRHIILFVLCLAAFVVLIIMLIAFLKMAVNTSGKYGNRLDGIKEVEISKSELKDISSKLEEKEEVSKASSRIQGKIIYFDVYFTKETTLDNAKKICSDIINEFEDDDKDFYDFSFVITQDGDNDDKWSSAGSRNSGSDSISWARS